MPTKRLIEIFSAGCAVCEETVQLVNKIACPPCQVEVLDLHRPEVAAKAKQYGLRSVPAVVDGNVASCCANRRPDEASLRDAGVGIPLS